MKLPAKLKFKPGDRVYEVFDDVDTGTWEVLPWTVHRVSVNWYARGNTEILLHTLGSDGCEVNERMFTTLKAAKACVRLLKSGVVK